MQKWRLILDGPASPPWNMAMDEALLRQAHAPVLRIYGWEEPAQSLGYFQKWTEANPKRPFVRRYTGGGLVDHGSDITYTIVLPRTHEWMALSLPESYEKIHAAIAEAMNKVGIDAQLAPCCDVEESGACFQKAVKYDLKVGNRKVAGAAQRRTREGLLHQGSILLPDVKLNEKLVAVLPQTLGEMLEFDWEVSGLESKEVDSASVLEKGRYRSIEWNKRV